MGDVRLDTSGLNLAKVAIGAAVNKTVRALAFAVQEQAVENIRDQGAIDTGSLLNSIYVETRAASLRPQSRTAAMTAAASVGKKSGKPSQNGADPAQGPPVEEHQARVASCVEHGIYIEMGVSGSATGDHAARPFLAPAAHSIQDKGDGVLAAILSEELGR